MKGIDGITTAKQIRKYDSQCKIIFITSSVNHALESFEVFPFSYILKPLSKALVNTVFDNAVNTISKEKQKILSIKVDKTLNTIYYKDILSDQQGSEYLKVLLYY